MQKEEIEKEEECSWSLKSIWVGWIVILFRLPATDVHLFFPLRSRPASPISLYKDWSNNTKNTHNPQLEEEAGLMTVRRSETITKN